MHARPRVPSEGRRGPGSDGSTSNGGAAVRCLGNPLTTDTVHDCDGSNSGCSVIDGEQCCAGINVDLAREVACPIAITRTHCLGSNCKQGCTGAGAYVFCRNDGANECPIGQRCYQVVSRDVDPAGASFRVGVCLP